MFQTIRKAEKKLLCINDAPVEGGIQDARAKLQAAFEELLPEASGFEQGKDLEEVL